MSQPRNSTTKLAILAAVAALVAIPTAAAASAPLLGEWEWMSWGGAFVIIGIVGALAFVFPQVRAGVKKVPLLGGSSPAVLAVTALLIASFMNAGGILAGVSAPTASVAGATATDETVAFDAALYEPTSDVTFYVADAEDKTTQNAAIKIYKAGVDEKKVLEGSATSEYSGTASSGALTLSGIQVQTLGCNIDVHLDLSGFYEKLVRNVNICVPKNLLGNNDVSVPTMYIEDLGTASLSLSASTLTCAAAAQCSYTVRARNSEDDSWIRGVAVKWTESDTEEHTLDSVDAGTCEIDEVSGTKYIQFPDDIGPLSSVECTVKITRATGDDNGGFNMTLDDYYTYLDATAFNSNSNIRSVTATAAYEVTFA